MYLSYSFTKSHNESGREEVYKFHGHYKIYLFVFRTCIKCYGCFFVRRNNEFPRKNSRHDFRRQFTVLARESRLLFHQDFNQSSAP